MSKVTFENVLGFYDKRDCPGGRYECFGSARPVREEAGMVIYLFTPYNKSMNPVEATMDQL